MKDITAAFPDADFVEVRHLADGRIITRVEQGNRASTVIAAFGVSAAAAVQALKSGLG